MNNNVNKLIMSKPFFEYIFLFGMGIIENYNCNNCK